MNFGLLMSVGLALVIIVIIPASAFALVRPDQDMQHIYDVRPIVHNRLFELLTLHHSFGTSPNRSRASRQGLIHQTTCEDYRSNS